MGRTSTAVACKIVAVPRRFDRTIDDLPAADPLDWTLIEKLGELLNSVAVEGDSAEYEAHDRRGTVEQSTFEAFRQEVEELDEAPHSTTVMLDSDTFVRVTWGGHRLLAVILFGSNEKNVNHVEATLRYLFGRAANRREARQQEEARAAARQQVQSAPAPAPATASSPTATGSPATRVLNHQWVVAVGSGLVVAAIIALVIWVF
jgi:hypothetical protein